MQKYNVAITGTASSSDGRDLVNARLSQLFKISENQASKILEARTVIKRDVDEETARKYQAALQRIGVSAELEPIEQLSVDEVVAPAGAASSQTVTPESKPSDLEAVGKVATVKPDKKKVVVAAVAVLLLVGLAIAVYSKSQNETSTETSVSDDMEPPEGVYESPAESSAAQPEPGIEVSVSTQRNPIWEFTYGRIDIKSVSDHERIEAITLNRGNCTLDGVSTKRLPVELAFGQSVSLNSNARCDVIEVDITTSSGSWTYTFR